MVCNISEMFGTSRCCSVAILGNIQLLPSTLKNVRVSTKLFRDDKLGCPCSSFWPQSPCAVSLYT